jgi:glycosyltransferase involved in cell wall biosynthesis
MRQAGKIRRSLLIIDVSVAGHHPTYIRRLLESELSSTATIVLAARREMFSHPEILPYSSVFTAHEIESVPDLAALYKNPGTLNVMRASWIIGSLYRTTFERLSKTMDVGLVVVPFLDDCLAGLALPANAFAGTPWMAITMRTMFHFGAERVIAPPLKFGRLRRHLFERILCQNSLAAMLTIDPTLARFARRQRHASYGKIRYLPDPAAHHEGMPSQADARKMLDIPPTARVVLLYGEIAARKGVFALLESAADEACSRRLHVLLAGRYERADLMLEHPAYSTLMAQGRLHRVAGFLDDAGERTVLACSDCMWIGYTGFYLMSGVMVLAGRHGLPVIATREGLIGHWTREHDIGITVDIAERNSVVGALNQLVLEPQQLTRMGQNGIRAFAEHEPAILAQLVAETYALHA